MNFIRTKVDIEYFVKNPSYHNIKLSNNVPLTFELFFIIIFGRNLQFLHL